MLIAVPWCFVLHTLPTTVVSLNIFDEFHTYRELPTLVSRSSMELQGGY